MFKVLSSCPVACRPNQSVGTYLTPVMGPLDWHFPTTERMQGFVHRRRFFLKCDSGVLFPPCTRLTGDDPHLSVFKILIIACSAGDIGHYTHTN